jgi:two-component system phosphate regulon sensor histidine kinase PhoR
MRRKKLLWNYFLIVIILLTVISLWDLYRYRKSAQLLLERQETTIVQFGKAIAATLPEGVFVHPAEAEGFCNSIPNKDNLHLAIVALDGTVLGDSLEEPSQRGNIGDHPSFEEAALGGVGRSVRFNVGFSGAGLYVYVPVFGPEGSISGVLELSTPLDDAQHSIQNQHARWYITTVFILLLISLIGFLLLRSFYQPIETLQAAAEHYGRGDLTFLPHIEKPEELHILSETMKTMAGALKTRIDMIENQRYESDLILSSMVEAVIMLDSHLVIKKINRAGLTLLNRRFEEVENRSLIEVFRNSELYEFATQILLTRGPKETSIALYSTSPVFIEPDNAFPEKGKQLYLQVHGVSIDINETDESYTAVLLVLHDITKIKTLEEMRKDFVANVSHELKTPITSIKGFVETLLGGALKNQSKSEHFLEIINKHTNRLNSIIDDLLSLSRLEQTKELEFKRFSLSSIISRAIGVCSENAKQKNISVQMEAPDDISAEINPQLVEQAVVNLIDNSIKYSDPDSSVQIFLTSEDEHVKVSVADQGCGISPGNIDRVFERFYRVDKARSREMGGTGLGLAIVKHIALAHNGEALAQSSLGEGSVFTLILPKLQPAE